MGGPKIRAFQDALGPGATFEPKAILGSILKYSLEPISEQPEKYCYHYSIYRDAWKPSYDSVVGPTLRVLYPIKSAGNMLLALVCSLDPKHA